MDIYCPLYDNKWKTLITCLNNVHSLRKCSQVYPIFAQQLNNVIANLLINWNSARETKQYMINYSKVVCSPTYHLYYGNEVIQSHYLSLFAVLRTICIIEMRLFNHTIFNLKAPPRNWIKINVDTYKMLNNMSTTIELLLETDASTCSCKM